MTQYDPTRRTYLKGLATLGIAGGVAGCSGGGGSGGSGSGGSGGSGSGGSGGSGSGGSGGSGGGSQYSWNHDVPQEPNSAIRYQNLGSMDGDPAGAMNIEAFEKANPDLTVKPVITDPSNVLKFARTRLQGQDSKIDAYSLQPYDIWALAKEGFLEEVGQVIDDKNREALFDSIVDANTIPQPFHEDLQVPEGLYGTPGVGTEESWQPFVNMDVLEQAGYERKRKFENYADFRKVMKDIKSQGITDTPVIFPFADAREGGEVFSCHVVRAGGQYFDGSTPTFDSDAVKKGVENFLSLFQEGIAPQGVTSLTEGNASQQFFNSNAAVMFNASSNIFLPGKELPIDKPAEEVGRITQYPKPADAGDTPTLNITPTNFALSVFSKNKVNTGKWMNFYCSKEAQKNELVEEGNLALREDVYEDSEVKEKVPYVDELKRSLTDSITMKYPNPAKIKEMVYDKTTNAISSGWDADRLTQELQSEAENITG